MNQRKARSKRRGLVSSVEMLDDRLVLSVVAAMPATPAPTASPFGVAHIGKFEHDLRHVDRGLKIHAKHPKSYVTNRATYIQSVIARAASRANVQVQHVTVSSNASSSSGAATHGRAQNNRVDRLVASFNSSSSTTSTSASALPANATENNLHAAHAGVTGGVSAGASSAGPAAITSSSGATNVIASPSTPGSTSTSSSTATGSTTTTPATSSIGTIGAQVFSNAFTQAAGSINSTINGVNTSLERLVGSLETQSGNNIATTVTSFSSAPAGSFRPTVGFVSGNGVTSSSGT